VLYPLCLIRS